MPLANPTLFPGPVGPLRQKRVVTVGSDDIEFPAGAIVQANADGDIEYRTLYGSDTLTETVATGDTLGVGGIPVLVKEILGAASTVTEVVVGYL